MTREKRALEVYEMLLRHFGRPKCPLHYSKPHELCIAVILSAQCTDERVNQTTPGLFAALPDIEDLAFAPLPAIEELIRPTGFFKNKARHIQGFCRQIIAEHGGKIPDSMEALQSLPGVGRKTANVILQELHAKTEGVVVDTHVLRISRLLQFTRSSNPAVVEKDLMKILPPERWRDFSLLLIFLGRSFCKARVRNCGECPVRGVCPSKQQRP